MEVTSSNPWIYKASLVDKVQSYTEAVKLFLLYSTAESIYGAISLELFPFILIMETKMESLEAKSSEEGEWQVWGFIHDQKVSNNWNSNVVQVTEDNSNQIEKQVPL